MKQTPAERAANQASQAQERTEATQEIVEQRSRDLEALRQKQSDMEHYYNDQSALLETSKQNRLDRLEKELSESNAQWKTDLQEQRARIAENLKATGAMQFFRDKTGITAREQEESDRINRSLDDAQQREMEARQAVESEYAKRQEYLDSEYAPEKMNAALQFEYEDKQQMHRQETLKASPLPQDIQRAAANDLNTPEYQAVPEQQNNKPVPLIEDQRAAYIAAQKDEFNNAVSPALSVSEPTHEQQKDSYIEQEKIAAGADTQTPEYATDKETYISEQREAFNEVAPSPAPSINPSTNT